MSASSTPDNSAKPVAISSHILKSEEAGAVKPFDWSPRQVDDAPPAPLYHTPARKDAQESSAESEAALAERIEEAYRRGVRDGEGAHARQGAALLDARMQEFAAAIGHLASYRPRLRRDAEHDLVRLALTVARRLIRRELSVDPEALLGVVRSALDRLGAKEVYRLRLHPSQAAVVGRLTAGRVEVISDPELEPGALLFETVGGTLDAGLETQLREIERGLTDLLP